MNAYERRMDSYEQQVLNWRPTCCACEKPVDLVRVNVDEARRLVQARAFCHGAVSCMDFDQSMVNYYEGDIRTLIIKYGPFSEVNKERIVARNSRGEIASWINPQERVNDKIDTLRFAEAMSKKVAASIGLPEEFLREDWKKKPASAIINDDPELNSLAAIELIADTWANSAMISPSETLASALPTREQLKAMLAALGEEEPAKLATPKQPLKLDHQRQIIIK